MKSFYRNAAGAFLVYDITNYDSFKKLEFWIKEMKENAKQNLVLILVGNKNDRENERQVSKEEGLSFMRKNSISLFFETSAKTGDNIEIVIKENRAAFLVYILLGFPTNRETHFRQLCGTTNPKERNN